MTYEEFQSLCESRRSIHYFDDKPVSKEDVVKLLGLARLAPSVENLQPWFFYVVYNKELRRKLTDASCYGNFIEGAGVFIVVTANRSFVNASKEPVWNEKELEYSCMTAMTNILLGATAMGIGSCWVSLYSGKVCDVLDIPKHEIVVGGILLGHFKPGEEKGVIGEHERKPVGEICSFYE
jgi:nitroreductase